jgi:N-acetyl-anhydromuramyl-L-alanine amidase AmpD
MGERLERYDAINVHFVVTRAGKILRLYDLDTATCHGNGWNNQTVGIEIDGLYAGQEDDPTTLVDESLLTTWNDPTTPHRETPMQVTPEAMEAARNLVRWICEEVALNKGKVGVLVAHRQSSASRRNDPGEAIWRAVALPMMAELGLHSGGDGFKLDDGYPIPEVWGGANGIKY